MREPTTKELMEIERQAENETAVGEDRLEALLDAIEKFEKEKLWQKVKRIEKRKQQEDSNK
jgi:hypothetical protein